MSQVWIYIRNNLITDLREIKMRTYEEQQYNEKLLGISLLYTYTVQLITYEHYDFAFGSPCTSFLSGAITSLSMTKNAFWPFFLAFINSGMFCLLRSGVLLEKSSKNLIPSGLICLAAFITLSFSFQS